jgi:hypothetical protein
MIRKSAISAVVTLVLALAAIPASAQNKKHYAPVRPLDSIFDAETIEPAPSRQQVVIPGNGIDFHGGLVMTPTSGDGIVNLYFIWYGNWANGAKASDSQNTRDLMSALFSTTGLNNSSYEKVNQTYGDGKNNVTGSLVLIKQTSDNYSRGKILRDADVEKVVSNAISTGALPNDSHGLYFVLGSSDVAETSGFCVKYCGWHSSANLDGLDLKLGFVGNPDRCPSLCEAQATSPNSNSGADGMASVLAHETQESVNDPDGNAWYDADGNESSDKCAWKFGPTQTTADGARYNLTLANYHWLIQLNWLNSYDPATGQRGGCALNAAGPFYQR